MIDGRFDQQFSELFAGQERELSQPDSRSGTLVWPAGAVFLLFAVALAGLAFSWVMI